MISHRKYPNKIDDFINTQVISRGLDERTAKAYRMDLEKFYFWLEDGEGVETAKSGWNLEDQMEAYLDYLSDEKGLRYSTLYRKQRVFGYYLASLVSQGVLSQCRPLHPVSQPRKTTVDTLLTKREVEAFFQAIGREYEDLDSDFRRRVCLRDQVMMELLFYHGLEISQLLVLEVSDYNPKTFTLTIRRKREKDRTVYLFSRALQKQMAQWLSEHIYFEHGGMYHNRMFLSKLGKPLSMKMVINIFDKYRVMAGIEKVCKPKDLKNSLGRYAEELVREQG